MLGGLKNLAGIAGLLSQSGAIQEKLAQAKDRISRQTVEGCAGGDLVRIRMSGDFQVRGVSMQQGLIESRDRELIENLTRLALEDALRKARDAAAREMTAVAEGLNVPGLTDALTKLGIH